MVEAVSHETSNDQPWSDFEISMLKVLKAKQCTVATMAHLLDRTPSAVRVKISRLKIGRRYRCRLFEMRRGS